MKYGTYRKDIEKERLEKTKDDKYKQLMTRIDRSDYWSPLEITALLKDLQKKITFNYLESTSPNTLKTTMQDLLDIIIWLIKNQQYDLIKPIDCKYLSKKIHQIAQKLE